MDRVAIFIDGSNFYHGRKNNLPAGPLVNFERFALKLAGRRHLVRVYFYTAVVRRQDGERGIGKKGHNTSSFVGGVSRQPGEKPGNTPFPVC
ncbi:MAG: NYN domain-containing protein [candidate division WOR-3 bacterium]|nr:MAG: NYN domain-containing protein [candidate division WOR-3 bacterium]